MGKIANGNGVFWALRANVSARSNLAGDYNVCKGKLWNGRHLFKSNVVFIVSFGNVMGSSPRIIPLDSAKMFLRLKII